LGPSSSFPVAASSSGTDGSVRAPIHVRIAGTLVVSPSYGCTSCMCMCPMRVQLRRGQTGATQTAIRCHLARISVCSCVCGCACVSMYVCGCGCVCVCAHVRVFVPVRLSNSLAISRTLCGMQGLRTLSRRATSAGSAAGLPKAAWVAASLARKNADCSLYGSAAASNACHAPTALSPRHALTHIEKCVQTDMHI
jgi:hypothetical protein